MSEKELMRFNQVSGARLARSTRFVKGLLEMAEVADLARITVT